MVFLRCDRPHTGLVRKVDDFVGFFAFHQLAGTGKVEKQINMRVLHEYYITSFRV
jgi:hypothetical protein